MPLSNCRTFSGVTAEVLSRIKEVAHSEYGIVFDPPDGSVGTARGRTPLGECLMEFVHDSTRGAMVLTLIKKPMFLPAEALWRGLTETIEQCRKDHLRAPPVRTRAHRKRSSRKASDRVAVAKVDTIG